MHRCGSAFLLTLAITFVVAFTGCLGKSSSNSGNGGVQTVTLSPGNIISIDVGGTQIFSATAKNASGGTVLGVDIQFIVESGSPNASAPLSITSNGSACAGAWDQTGSMCSPGTPGIAYVRAVTAGVSSPPTTVFVHQHIDSIQVSRLDPQGPPLYDCFSQGQTWGYQGIAYSNNVDITNSVGPMSWSSSNTGVLSTDTTLPTLLPNQVQVTAKAPGITQLFATASGTTSIPYPYTTCLIQSIRLQIGGQGAAGNSITVNNGGSVPITATAVDTLYQYTGVALSSPPLTWSTTNPEVAAFSSTTNTSGSNGATARNNFGGATVFASCTPPTCNIGVLPGLPIYASDGKLPNGTKGYGTIAINVTAASTSKPPTYTAWAATTGCQNAPGCSSAMFSVTPGTTPIGSILSLPRTPNSMMFNHVSAARVYLGSDQGLMYVDVTTATPCTDPTMTCPSFHLVSNSSIPCSASLCGKILTISNDGNQVVVSDTVSTPSQVYIYNAGSTSTAPIDLILSVPGETATAAAFSPDQLKLFIATSAGNMYVYSTVDALTSIPIATSVTAVEFSADGSFAYVAGTPGPTSVSGFATCDTPATSVVSPITTTFPAFAIYPSPTLQLDKIGNPTEVVLALDPPNIDMFGVNAEQSPLLYNQFACNPPSVALDPNFPKTSDNLGQGNFTPIYAQLVADGSEVLLVAKRIPAVLLFNVSNGTTTSVPLVNSADPLSASASTDGSQVYVAACDQYDQDGTTCAVGSVHIVNTISQGDFQQVPYVNINQNNNRNMCNNNGNPAPQCLPNLIAIKPQ